MCAQTCFFLAKLNNAAATNKVLFKIRINPFILRILYFLNIRGFIDSFYIKKYQNTTQNLATVILHQYSMNRLERMRVIPLPIYNDTVRDFYNPLKNLKVISKPSRRIYMSVKELIKLPQHSVVYVISTKLGLLTTKEAIAANLGGEVCFTFNL